MSTTSLQQIPSGVYNVDPVHSNVGFEIRHMGIATVRGKFGTFEGRIDATAGAPALEGTVDVSTIDTGEPNRDGHLKSPEFFDVERYPQITFRGSATEAAADGRLTLSGEITMHGVTQPIELTGELAENGEDPWGNQRVGFELTATIDRREFGLDWNQALPNGNPLLANEVKLLVGVSAVKSA